MGARRQPSRLWIRGPDVIFGAGGVTGNGALQEIATADGAGETVFCIGVDTDQWNTVPAAHPCLVSSAMKLITPGVVDLGEHGERGRIPWGELFRRCRPRSVPRF